MGAYHWLVQPKGGNARLVPALPERSHNCGSTEIFAARPANRALELPNLARPPCCTPEVMPPLAEDLRDLLISSMLIVGHRERTQTGPHFRRTETRLCCTFLERSLSDFWLG